MGPSQNFLFNRLFKGFSKMAAILTGSENEHNKKYIKIQLIQIKTICTCHLMF